VALLQVPPIGRLHEPLSVELILRNESPVRTANVSISIGVATGSGAGDAEADGGGGQGTLPQQQFVVAGIKNGRLGVVLPGEEQRVVWVVVPLECGYLRVPRVKVLDWRGRGEEGIGEEVEVVDATRYYGVEGRFEKTDKEIGDVLVLP
jgi:hypothetical protein